jgi:hypothetical protein
MKNQKAHFGIQTDDLNKMAVSCKGSDLTEVYIYGTLVTLTQGTSEVLGIGTYVNFTDSVNRQRTSTPM